MLCGFLGMMIATYSNARTTLACAKKAGQSEPFRDACATESGSEMFWVLNFFNVARCIQKILNCWRGSTTVLCCKEFRVFSARATLRASTPLSAEVVSWATPCAPWVCSCSGLCWPSTARRGCSGWQKNDPIKAADEVSLSWSTHCLPEMVNVYITMENHHFEWEISL